MKDSLFRIGCFVSPNSSANIYTIVTLKVVNAKLLLTGAMLDREIHNKIDTEIG